MKMLFTSIVLVVGLNIAKALFGFENMVIGAFVAIFYQLIDRT